MARFHQIVNGRWHENCWIVANGFDAVVVDPGGAFDEILAHVSDQNLHVHAVVNTHAHYDHLGAVAATCRHYDVPFFLHPEDSGLLVRANFYRTLFLGEESIEIPRIDSALSNGDTLAYGDLVLEVLHTPGHTAGSVCVAVDDELLTGDTIMAEHLGRTDLPGGDRATLLQSIDLLATRFDGTTRIHPGHGSSALLGDVLPRVLALPELR